MAATKPSTLTFYYEKGNHFRVVHVDGVIGGLTPTRDIFLSVYNQRSALPKVIEQVVTPDGQLGASEVKESKHGIFREMEIGLVMTPEVADQIADFLKQHSRAAKQTLPVKDRVDPEKKIQ